MSVEYQENYHIIPFAYELPYSAANQLLQLKSFQKKDKKSDGVKDVLVWKDKEFKGRQRLFSHINCLIKSSSCDNNTIGIGFMMEDGARGYFNLPANKNHTVMYKDKNENFEFCIKDIELYIFETQVGFLTYKIEVKSTDEKDIMKGNYFVKSLVQNKDKFFVKDRNEEIEEVNKILLHECIEKILNDLNVVTYFENNDNFPKQAIVYNTMCLRSNPGLENIENYMYKMRRLFKDSYKPCKRELTIDNCKDIIQLFDNSYWGISLEGFANLVYLVEDEKTDNFMKGNYKGELENTYYYMYLLALHQRYALLYFSIQVSDIKKNNDKEIIDENIINNISELKHDISYFYLRAIFSNISNITHQSELYDLLRDRLRIEDLMDEINSELDGLKAILEERKCKVEAMKEKRREDKRNRFHIFIAIISVIFVILQTDNSVWDMFNKGWTGLYPSIGSITFYGLIISFMVVTIGSVIATGIYVEKLIKEKNDNKK